MLNVRQKLYANVRMGYIDKTCVNSKHTKQRSDIIIVYIHCIHSLTFYHLRKYQINATPFYSRRDLLANVNKGKQVC